MKKLTQPQQQALVCLYVFGERAHVQSVVRTSLIRKGLLVDHTTQTLLRQEGLMRARDILCENSDRFRIGLTK